MTTATDPLTEPAATSTSTVDAHGDVPAGAATDVPGATAPSSYAVAPADTVEEQRGFAVSSLVLGLVSIVAGFTFVVPVAGLVLGILALRREPSARTMAIWGIVLNAVMLAGIVIAGLVTAAVGIALLPLVPFAFIG